MQGVAGLEPSFCAIRYRLQKGLNNANYAGVIAFHGCRPLSLSP
jgi:hypothetical protein